MYFSEAQSLSMICKIDQQCQQDVVVPFYHSHNGSASRITLCTSRASRPPIKKIGRKDGWNTIPYGTELKAGVLVENISDLSRRTITRAGCSPERSHQSSLCSPHGYSSDAICLCIPHAPKTTLSNPIRNIGRRKNN